MNAQVDFWLTTDATPVHDAPALTEGGSLAPIVLDGQVCALRITRAGMLIVTKQALSASGGTRILRRILQIFSKRFAPGRTVAP